MVNPAPASRKTSGEYETTCKLVLQIVEYVYVHMLVSVYVYIHVDTHTNLIMISTILCFFVQMNYINDMIFACMQYDCIYEHISYT